MTSAQSTHPCHSGILLANDTDVDMLQFIWDLFLLIYINLFYFEIKHTKFQKLKMYDKVKP